MFYKALRTPIIATSLFLAAGAAEAGVIEYQEVALRYTIGTSVIDFDDNTRVGDFGATQIEPNPQDVTSSSALNGGSANLGLTFDLDEDNNTFTLDASVAAINNLAENVGSNVEATIRLFIDFTVASDNSDPVELLFTADSSFLGLEDIVQTGFEAGVSSRLGAGSTRIDPNDPFSRTVRFPSLAGLGVGDRTQSIVVVPNQTYSIVSTLDLNNRSSATTFVDGVGNLRVTTSLAVATVPEPPLLGALSLGVLILMRRRRLQKAQLA